MQGGACYEEVHDLWQRVTKAEQAASETAAELHTHKDAARRAALELKVSALYLVAWPLISHPPCIKTHAQSCTVLAGLLQAQKDFCTHSAFAFCCLAAMISLGPT